MARTLADCDADLAVAYSTRRTLLSRAAQAVSARDRSIQMQDLEKLNNVIRGLEQEREYFAAGDSGGGIILGQFNPPCSRT